MRGLEAFNDDGHLEGKNKIGRQEDSEGKVGGSKTEGVVLPSTSGQNRVKSFREKRKGSRRKRKTEFKGDQRGSSFHYRYNTANCKRSAPGR